MDVTELDRESAELLPDRQALGCWNYGWHGCHGAQGWHGWQSWHGCGHGSTDVSLSLNLNVSSQYGSWGW